MSEPVPAFVFSRESKIRIDRDGYFWHEGERVEHQGLAQGLARWIAVDPESNRYVLRNTMDWCFVTVDDAPLVVRSVTIPERGAVTLALSDGTSEDLSPGTVRIDADDVPYCDVRQGTLPARFGRSAAFALLERVCTDADRLLLELPTGRYPVRRVGRGDGALTKGTRDGRA